jgi:hypothetical protein
MVSVGTHFGLFLLLLSFLSPKQAIGAAIGQRVTADGVTELFYKDNGRVWGVITPDGTFELSRSLTQTQNDILTGRLAELIRLYGGQ